MLPGAILGRIDLQRYDEIIEPLWLWRAGAE